MESAESAPSTKAVKKPRVQWTEKATWALIKSWQDNLDALRGQKHNGVVYQRIAESLTDAGIPRTRAQVHAKIDNLTQTFSPFTALKETQQQGQQGSDGGHLVLHVSSRKLY
ncbi:hypothetical protein HPB52_000779 [Rhipicephalus sanguineus]|uniref:Myb/SANT-like DNA-binding domain-containing protein n=1 Tax=Rhipicephalus sanguineus TaxID=34632 RepID=A0A9D4SXW4_RHISA|nr:hypothetical protein HPB52_000779 [Rhipicephalus sanguineus]